MLKADIARSSTLSGLRVVGDGKTEAAVGPATISKTNDLKNRKVSGNGDDYVETDGNSLAVAGCHYKVQEATHAKFRS